MHWSQRRRDYTVYHLRHAGGNAVYVGVMARPLRTRLREHLRTGRRDSPCALHRALATLPREGWAIRAVERVSGPLHAARQAEHRRVRALRRRGRARVLNSAARDGYTACHPPNSR